MCLLEPYLHARTVNIWDWQSRQFFIRGVFFSVLCIGFSALFIDFFGVITIIHHSCRFCIGVTLSLIIIPDNKSPRTMSLSTITIIPRTRLRGSYAGP